MNQETFDVVVIGGGAGGLSAATILSRSRRSVLVVDGGEPRNAAADHIHSYLGREGTPPPELFQIGRDEVAAYGGRLRCGRVVDVTGAAGNFLVELADGDSVRARRLVLATGLVDVLPDIEGIHARWGRDVLHCPYCHGWEVRDRHVGVVASPFMPDHVAQLFRQLTERVTLFTHDARLDAEQRAGLEARGIVVADRRVEAVTVTDDRLTGVRLADGSIVGIDALVVPTQMMARAEIAERLGAEMTEMPFGRHVAVVMMGATSVPGLWAVGNVANLGAQVIVAAAEGTMAGAAVNFDLVREEVDTARASR